MNEDVRVKSIGELKRGAKEKLKGNWGIAILLTFLTIIIINGFSFATLPSKIMNAISRTTYYLTYGVRQTSEETVFITTMSYLGILIKLLIGGAITYGVCRFYLDVARKEKLKLETLFSGFKHFVTNFLIQLVIGIFTFLWSLVLYVPIFIIAIISIVVIGLKAPKLEYFYDQSANEDLIIGLAIIIVIVSIISSIILYLLTARYAMAYYIYADNPDYSTMECISASKEMMEGNKVRLLLLQLSFIGWHILSVLSLFIGYLWLIPYINSSAAEFYNNLKEISEPKVEKNIVENNIEDRIEITLEKDQDTQ